MAKAFLNLRHEVESSGMFRGSTWSSASLARWMVRLLVAFLRQEDAVSKHNFTTALKQDMFTMGYKMDLCATSDGDNFSSAAMVSWISVMSVSNSMLFKAFCKDCMSASGSLGSTARSMPTKVPTTSRKITTKLSGGRIFRPAAGTIFAITLSKICAFICKWSSRSAIWCRPWAFCVTESNGCKRLNWLNLTCSTASFFTM